MSASYSVSQTDGSFSTPMLKGRNDLVLLLGISSRKRSNMHRSGSLSFGVRGNHPCGGFVPVLVFSAWNDIHYRQSSLLHHTWAFMQPVLYCVVSGQFLSIGKRLVACFCAS